MRHDHMRQALRGLQRVAGTGEFVRQVGGGDSAASVRVGNVVLEFLTAVHRVYRYHHRAYAQYGPMRGHQLGTVLHVEQNPVTRSHADLVQERGKPLRLFVQLPVAEHRAEEHQSGLVGIAHGADGQVVPQRGRRWRDSPRRALGPKWVVRTNRRTVRRRWWEGHGVRSCRWLASDFHRSIRAAPRHHHGTPSRVARCLWGRPLVPRKTRWPAPAMPGKCRGLPPKLCYWPVAKAI